MAHSKSEYKWEIDKYFHEGVSYDLVDKNRNVLSWVAYLSNPIPGQNRFHSYNGETHERLDTDDIYMLPDKFKEIAAKCLLKSI